MARAPPCGFVRIAADDAGLRRNNITPFSSRKDSRLKDAGEGNHADGSDAQGFGDLA
jgi:hypothetical protein